MNPTGTPPSASLRAPFCRPSLRSGAVESSNVESRHVIRRNVERGYVLRVTFCSCVERLVDEEQRAATGCGGGELYVIYAGGIGAEGDGGCGVRTGLCGVCGLPVQDAAVEVRDNKLGGSCSGIRNGHLLTGGIGIDDEILERLLRLLWLLYSHQPRIEYDQLSVRCQRVKMLPGFA